MWKVELVFYTRNGFLNEVRDILCPAVKYLKEVDVLFNLALLWENTRHKLLFQTVF